MCAVAPRSGDRTLTKAAPGPAGDWFPSPRRLRSPGQLGPTALTNFGQISAASWERSAAVRPGWRVQEVMRSWPPVTVWTTVMA